MDNTVTMGNREQVALEMALATTIL